MNKLATAAKLFTVTLGCVAAMTSCSNGTAASPAPAAAPVSTDAPASLNIRYIDGDSVAAHYNLAKDFREVQLQAMSKLDAAGQSKAKNIQNFAAQVQEKAQNNGYLSETSYNADMTKLQRMQQEAEQSLAVMQRNSQQELAVFEQAVTDSINNFIADYNKEKGYDMILYRAAGVYFNPALDITNEVIEGLNARYNKVEAPKK
ncbi:MAG: OmpH family outer membrane protein [Pseudoflavonifractor sp.]|nr:OmpH family outer membrane protein [Alloprevotella sp.]MCM1115934.1 OmpH family outer membrane protein [Pseudoflavonifractor sp.]